MAKRGVNEIIIIGNLGKDPQSETFPSGTTKTMLTIATTESWTDKGSQRQEETEWHRIILWGKRAEAARDHLRKGRQVYIKGKNKTRNWVDEASQQKRYITEIIATDMQMLGGKGYDTPDAAPSAEGQQYSSQDDFDNDVPV